MRQIFLSRTNLIILTLSLLSSFVIFGNTLKGEFVYDDSLYIHSIQSFSETNFIKIWSSSLIPEAQGIGVYRPFSVFVFWLNYSIFSQNPIYFHLLNIILNGLVVFMVYKTSFQIFKNLKLSLFAASLFSVLPIHSEAVSNIKSFDDLMATLFGLLSLYFFIKVAPQKIKWRFVLASTFFSIH